ncbi:MAG: alpha/beta hydrolase [Thermodesulfobacteriota bacterium]
MVRTMVMIHGMFGGSWCWENYRGFFGRRGYRCLAPALRHHDVDPKGAPHPELGTVSLLDYADDLERMIRGLDEKPVLIGHSMGGLITQILGSRKLGSALVLLASAAPAGISAITPSVMKSISTEMIEWGFWRKPIKSTFESTSYSAMHLLPEAERRAAYGRYVHDSGRAFFEIGFSFLDPRKAASIDERKIDDPMLVVVGAEDRITPASVNLRIARKYKGYATYMEFPRHAHWIFGEPGWERVAASIHGWLNDSEKGG